MHAGGDSELLGSKALAADRLLFASDDHQTRVGDAPNGVHEAVEEQIDTLIRFEVPDVHRQRAGSHHLAEALAVAGIIAEQAGIFRTADDLSGCVMERDFFERLADREHRSAFTDGERLRRRERPTCQPQERKALDHLLRERRIHVVYEGRAEEPLQRDGHEHRLFHRVYHVVAHAADERDRLHEHDGVAEELLRRETGSDPAQLGDRGNAPDVTVGDPHVLALGVGEHVDPVPSL